MTITAAALATQSRLVAERQASIGPEVWQLLLTCARIGLDSGPITTPEQRALDALLTALMGETE